MEKSGQIPVEIDPALVAHSDDAMCAETGPLISDGHSDENASRMWAFFPASVATKYGRAHTVFRLHFADLSFCCSRA
jgi:hypothetical protein